MVGKKLLPNSHPLSGDKPFGIWIVDSAGKEVRLMEFASREEQLVWEAHRSSRERKNRIAEGSPNKKFHASASDVGKVRSAKELRQQRKPTQWVVDEIGASGACVLLGADKGSGKTSLLYQLANSISKGEPFMDQLPTQKRKVVVVQGDESSTNASDKLDIMGIDADFDFVFPEEMGWQGIEVPKLSKLIDDNSYGAVLLDSVTTLLGNETQGFRMNDAEFAAPLYQLNNLASKKNLLIMITSHLRKADTQQPRGISLDDILGAGTQSAAVSDVWGMWRHDKPELEDHYIMQCLGKRNCQQGTAWNLQGSQEDYS